MILIIIHRSKPPDVRIEHIDDFRPSAPRDLPGMASKALGLGPTNSKVQNIQKKYIQNIIQTCPNMSKTMMLCLPVDIYRSIYKSICK